MADDKIRISWDDVRSAPVDAKLKQQAAVERVQEHYAQTAQSPTAAPPAMPPSGTVSMLRNTIVLMALFGAMGGLVAWAGGEIVQMAMPNYLEELAIVLAIEEQITTSTQRGDISSQQAEIQQEQLYDSYRSNPYIGIMRDDSLTENVKVARFKEQQDKDQLYSRLQQLFWFSTVAMAIAAFLSIAEPLSANNRRGAVVNGGVGIVLGLLGGAVVSLFVDQLYSALGGGQSSSSITQQMMARTMGWAVLGLFLAIAPGVVLRNWKRLLIGLGGGFIGGLLGGLLFDPVAFVAHNAVVSRFVAIISIGVIAGAATGIIEQAAKTGWLRVVAGLIAGKQFILYRNPTYIGSAPQCEIYLFKDPQIDARHAAVHIVPGGFEIEDLKSRANTFVNSTPISRVRLKNNDHVQIGSTTFVFQEKTQPRQ